MKGRKPIPKALHVLRGNPSRLRLDQRQEPAPGPASLEPPASLAIGAHAEWSRVAPMLARLGVLTESDTAALGAYCEAWLTWTQATRQVRQKGLVVDRPDGAGVMMSPYLKIANEAQAYMLRFMTEFGMTPSSRARIRTPAVQETVSKWGNV